MAGADSLCGAVFSGFLEPPGAPKCELVYKFRELLPPPAPVPVRNERRSLGWPCKADIECIAAAVSVPSLGLEQEEVVVSLDPPLPVGTRRALLQSVRRPELGLTVLELAADGRHLVGGDDTWKPVAAEEEPRFEALDCVVGGEGWGRSIAFRGQSDASRREAAAAKGLGGQGDAEVFMRPDMEVGQPRRPTDVGSLSAGALDAEIRAADAEASERLVAAAAAGERGDVLQLLVRLGADKRAPAGPFEGLTPLMAAAQRGRAEIVALLLERRAALEVRDESGWTALLHATQGQRPDCVRLLLDAKAGAQAAGESDGRTALMLAAAGARPELCSALLKAGSAKEARDKEGMKALHHAAKNGNGGSMLALLSAKARVDDRCHNGLTPLLLAAAAGRAEAVKLLVAVSADVGANDAEGRTAAKLASIYGHERVLQALSGLTN